ncbi:flagellar basal body L-ring protein FlgH [Succinivibrio dextrinosolvens]|uniref:flagellar basal body L-ring protein FlgH n=1 Tax=Succinivibrio dextrinosolvens TaxID=83771 RepID=UPI00247949CE|nr:flagellar basal body L-ring protein FlgH [Succinivibrio dextrinosolvens]
MNKIVLITAVVNAFLLQGCALDTFSPKPDDPKFAPALPEEDYSNVVPTGGIYNPYTLNNGMYSDTSAHKVGDIISVTLEESTSASKNANTSLTKNNQNNYGGMNLAFGTDDNTVNKYANKYINRYSPTLTSNNSNTFSGTGKGSQSNSLKGQISVSVVKVYANGNLQVQGEKWLMLNNGNEYVRVTGLIRPSDISSDNTVSSQRIANARIQYGGTGDFADTQERGFISRLFNSAFNIFF